MIANKRVLAYIPARGGSKGVPHKNLRLLGGKPLVVHTIEAAREANSVDYVFVSTDSEKIAEVARRAGAHVPFLRPDYLASDTARNIDGVVHALETLEAQEDLSFDIVMVLQPTGPFRDTHDIEGSLACFIEHDMQGLVSVSPARDFPILMRSINPQTAELTHLVDTGSTVRRQDMPEYVRVDGAIAINRTDEISPELSINDNPIGYMMPDNHGFDIDTLEDLAQARSLLKQLNTDV